MSSFSTHDTAFMVRALQLAQRGLYTTDPNPRVGCVLVNDGRVVGEGWHQWAGEPHAEVLALQRAGASARGATCYVTLEPCAHRGRTGPCTEALMDAGVARVVAAMVDPNPLVAGQGLAALQAAGINVSSGLLQAQAQALNPGFVRRMTTGRPWVRLKLAMSLDGRTAMASGESRWITGSAAREDVQHWRARSSAIITGAGTVQADNPALTVRPDTWEWRTYGSDRVRQPLRVVLDGQLQTPPDAQVLAEPGAVLLVCARTAVARSGSITGNAVEIMCLPPDATGGRNLQLLLAQLAERGCNEVLVECGATLAGAFVRERLVDELLVYMAPTIMGSSARPLLNLPDIVSMDMRLHWKTTDVCQLGDDLRLILTPASAPSPV